MTEIVQLITPSGTVDDVLKITNTSSTDVSYTFGDILQENGDYTFSCYFQGDTNTSTEVFISNNSKQFVITTEWQRVVYTAIVNIENSKNVKFTIPAGKSIYAYKGQLEKGNKPTDFNESPEDNNDKIETLQTDFKVQQGKIATLIRETTVDGGTLKDKLNQTVKTVDGIKTTILDVKSGIGKMESHITDIELTANGLKTTVEQHGTDIENTKTTAEQAADKITWIVQAGTDKTNFQLTERTADIVASYINLKGLVTFNGLNSEVQDKVNQVEYLEYGGRNLIYNTDFSVSQIDNWSVDGSASISMQSEYMKVAQSMTGGCYAKYGKGFKKGKYKITFVAYADSDCYLGNNRIISSDSSIVQDQRLDDWLELTTTPTEYSFEFSAKNNFPVNSTIMLGALGAATWYFKDMYVEYQGTTTATVINGANIETGTITADQLNVGDILAENGTFLGIINAQNINANRITSGEISANLISLYGLRVLHKDTNVETLSILDNGDITMRGSIESYNYISGKNGWSIKADGDAEFNDVTVRGNVITNDGGIVSSGGTGINLQKNSSFYNGLNDWTVNARYTCDTELQYNGLNTAKFERTGLTADATAYLYSARYSIKASVGETFTAQAKFYTANVNAIDGNGIYLAIWFYDINGNAVSRTPVQVNFENNSWVYVEATATAPAETDSVALVIDSRRNGTFNVAQPKIERGNVATTWSLAPEDTVKQVRFWAGSSYEQREFAPWIVYNDGSMKATMGDFSGVFSGEIKIGNISIIDPSSSSGNDALLTIQDGDNGVKKVQLRDTDSSFAQDVFITDNQYNSVIELKQNGTAIFKESVLVGDNTALSNKQLTLYNHRIVGSNDGLNFYAPNVDIGSIDEHSDLNIYGNSIVNGNLNLDGIFYYGNVVKCTTTTDGINFDFVD